MEFKNILILLCVSLLLIGAVSAQKTVNDFKVDESYNSAFNGTYNSLYFNEKQDSGVTIYQYLDSDVDDDVEAYDNLMHDDGRDYITPDDDFKIEKNSDNTANFTDYDHAQHGVVEMINIDGEDFVIVFWVKDSSSINNSDLISYLHEFNKDNNVKAIAF